MTVSPDILIVEDGTIVENANSYVTFEFAEEYHQLRGNSEWLNPELTVIEKQQAIIRATQALDSLYMGKWLGAQVDLSSQNLQFPRTGIKINDTDVPSNIVPKPVQYAVCEFALKELVSPNAILSDMERGGDIRRVKADTVEVEYLTNASSKTAYQKVDGIIGNYVSGTSSSSVGVGDVSVNW